MQTDQDAVPPRWPVSVKGVVLRHGRVLLLRNDRDEWELPGGRLEPGETPQECVAREIEEESGWQVGVGPVLDCWVYAVTEERQVVIVTYGCAPHDADAEPVVSSEHGAAGLFTPSEVARLPMPDGYRRSIRDWLDRSPA